LVAVIWYLIIVSILSVIQYYIERHYARGGSRNLPLTPLQGIRMFLGLTWRRPLDTDEKRSAS
jgi:polar amino acid transport system permease protein